MWEMFSSLRVPRLFRQFNIWCCWDEKDEKKKEHSARSLAEDERKPASTFAITPMPRSLTFVGFALACIPAQLMLAWRIKQLLPTIFMLNNVYLLRGEISFHLRVGACTHLPSGSPQHDASCVTPTDLIFPGHISVCSCLHEVLVHKRWLLIKGSFRDQRLET